MYIPYGRQCIEEDDIEAVVEVLKSDYLTTGPKISEFEHKFAEYVGAKYAVAVSNGTAALHVACLAAGLKKGDEAITTPITFAASANCVLYVGAKPVFADICKDTYNIDPKDIEKKITTKTKVLIPVHFQGQPCDMDAIHEIARKHKLIVIEDAAHAAGASYKGKRIGGLSDMTTFSFHPVKNITTGEGGMITTNNEVLYEKLKLYRTHGITRDKRYLDNTNEGDWFYEQQELGFNYRMTDFQAALGLSQLNKLDGFNLKRREIAERYNKYFEDYKEIITPYQSADSQSSYHLYVIATKGDRKELFDRLRAKGVGANVHYIPVYFHPYYRKMNEYKDVICPVAEDLYSKIISLPIYPMLKEDEQEYVVKIIKNGIA